MVERRFARAGAYGLTATVGIGIVSAVALWWARESRGEQALLVWGVALAVNLTILFVLVGEFVDAKLAEHGLLQPGTTSGGDSDLSDADGGG